MDTMGIINVDVQYGQDGYLISGGPYAEQDADSATVWVYEPMYDYPDGHDGPQEWVNSGHMYLALARSPRGKWMIESSDTAKISITGHRYRFRTVADAVDYVARVNGHVVWL